MDKITAKPWVCTECGTRYLSMSTSPKCCGVVSIAYKGKKRDLELGSTARGKSQFKPVVPQREPGDDRPPSKPGDFRIREIPASHGHATKRRAHNANIRKSPNTGDWR